MTNSILYAISNGKQGFFSAVSGKYVPVTERDYRKWTQTKQKWWYTLGVITETNGVTKVHLNGTKEWNKKITPAEHFDACLNEFHQLIKSHTNVIEVIHFFGLPNHPNPTNETVSTIIDILDGVYDTK